MTAKTDRLMAITMAELARLYFEWRSRLLSSDDEVYITPGRNVPFVASLRAPYDGQPFLILDGSGTLGLATIDKAWTTIADLNLDSLYRLASLND